MFLPTSLTFGAVSIAYINPDEKAAEALSSNSIFVLVIVLAVYWTALLVTMFGSRGFAAMAKWGGVIGVFIPIIVLVGLGAAYALAGNAPEMKVGWDELVPDFSNFSTIVLAASIFLMYAGMEMNAVHVKEVKDATRNFPIAIFTAAIIVVAILVLGTLAIAWIVPQSDINLTQAILTTYFDIFKWAGIPWAGPALAVGVLVNVTTWVAGPSTGLLAVAKAGYLPKFFQKTNRHGSAVTILLIQSGLVSAMAILFVVLPSVQSAYQILNQLANVLYLTVYMLMFAAIIRLRYSQKDQPRPFRLGKSNTLVWIIAGAGFVASLAAYAFSFIPPDQINVGSPVLYIAILVGAALVFYAIPNIIFQLRKPSWVTYDPDFAPFTWQERASGAADAAETAAPAAATDAATKEQAMSTTSYSSVRFIGYAIPTTPADMVDVGDPNGSGAVAGTYRASDDFETDISSRLAVLATAVETAMAELPADETGVLTVFVVPEFYWHGTHGPYVHAPGEDDPADVILGRLEAQFGGAEYSDVLFVFGSVISAEVANIDAVFASSTTTVRNDIVRALGEGWRATDGPLSNVIFDAFVNFVKNCHAYPEVEVRNRSLVIAGPGARGVVSELAATSLTTEKAFDSNEDFLLWDVPAAR